MAMASRNRGFESLYSYDRSIDYDREVQEYNRLVEHGDKVGAKELLRRNGGILSLLAKREHQRGTIGVRH